MGIDNMCHILYIYLTGMNTTKILLILDKKEVEAEISGKKKDLIKLFSAALDEFSDLKDIVSKASFLMMEKHMNKHGFDIRAKIEEMAKKEGVPLEVLGIPDPIDAPKPKKEPKPYKPPRRVVN